jgi:murein DD-endopeptidase MepM/ murein hydrolase activator NlpD
VALLASGCTASGGASPQPGTQASTTTTSAVAPSTSLTSPAPATEAAAPTSTGPVFTFPLAGKTKFAQYHHDYPATDVFAPCGTDVVAPFAGTVIEVAAQDMWRGSTNLGADRGGLSVTLVGADTPTTGDLRFYASHLSEVNVAPGITVENGDLLGRVGESGSAKGTGCHTHVGLSPAQCGPGDWWTRRGVINPYEYLVAWRDGQQLSPAPEVAAWHTKNGCPAKPAAYP